MKKTFKKIIVEILIVALVFNASCFSNLRFVYADTMKSADTLQKDMTSQEEGTSQGEEYAQGEENDSEDSIEENEQDEQKEEKQGEVGQEEEQEEIEQEEVEQEEAEQEQEEVEKKEVGKEEVEQKEVEQEEIEQEEAEQEEAEQEKAEQEEAEASPSDIEEEVEEEIEEETNEEVEQEEASPSEIEEVIEASPSDMEEIVEASPSEVEETYADYDTLDTFSQITYFDEEAAELYDNKIVFLKDVEFTKTINVNSDFTFDFGGYTVRGTENADPVFDIKNANVVFENGNLYAKNGADNKKGVGESGGTAIRFYSESGENTISVLEGAKIYGGNGGKGKGKDMPLIGSALTIGDVSYSGRMISFGGMGAVGGGDGGRALYITNESYDFKFIDYEKGAIIAGNAGETYGIFKTNLKFGADLPTKYDLRNVDNKNYVTRLKLQPGDTCFAFAPTAHAESYMLKNYPEYVSSLGKNVNATYSRKNENSWTSAKDDEFDLSEIYLAMSSFMQPSDAYGNAGDSDVSNGGTWYSGGGAYLNMPYMLLSTPRSLIMENNALQKYEYDEEDPPSDLDRGMLNNYKNDVKVVAKNIEIHDFSNYNDDDTKFINDMKNTIKDNVGTVLSFVFSDRWVTSSGNYSGYNVCYAEDGGSAAGGHALYVIGWDDNIPASELSGGGITITQKGAFIVKDSNGNRFGLVPYQSVWKLPDADGKIGYSAFTKITWEPAFKNYENYYYYDGGNSSNSSNGVKYDPATISSAGQELKILIKYSSLYNAFKIKNDKEKLKAVSYYSLIDEKVDIGIYQASGDTVNDLRNINLTSDLLYSKTNVNVKYGNNVISIDQDISCDKNDYLFVRVHNHNNSQMRNFFIDTSGNYGMIFNTMSAGKSYVGDYSNDSYANLYVGGTFSGNVIETLMASADYRPIFYNESPNNANYRIKLLTNNYVTVSPGSNSGSGKFSDDTLDDKYVYPTLMGKVGTLPTAKPVDSNKMFDRYNSKADGTGTDYNADSTYSVASLSIANSLTLYAQYINKPTISFKTERGTTPSDIKPNEYGKVTSLPSVSASNYTFKYWYLDNANKAFDYANYKYTSDNITLTAKWVYSGGGGGGHSGGRSGGGGGGGGGGAGIPFNKAASNNVEKKTLSAPVAVVKQYNEACTWTKDAFGKWHLSTSVAGENIEFKNCWCGLETEVNINGIVIKVEDYYFLDENGQMITGLLTDETGAKYFLDTSNDANMGKMCINVWKNIDGNNYYFGADGKMVVNAVTPDGSVVDAEGKMVTAGENSMLTSPMSIGAAGGGGATTGFIGPMLPSGPII